MATKILVLYYSVHGATRALAEQIALGVEKVTQCEAVLRTVPKVDSVAHTAEPIPSSGAPYVTVDDLHDCAGLIYGSPTRFGNMAAAMKFFWDGTADKWASGTLVGKPAAVFTSSSSAHGGQESTLLSMYLPLLHHGMLIVGVPFYQSPIGRTKTGGTPYGASHVAHDAKAGLSLDEIDCCQLLGQRVAAIAVATRTIRN